MSDSKRVGAESNAGVLARLSARLAGVSDAAIRKADGRAIASVKRRMEPAAKRVVREAYNVKAGDLAGQFPVRVSTLSGGSVLRLYASTNKLPLALFGGRWAGRKSPGATAQIEKGGSRKVYASAFIANIGGQRRMLVRQFSRDSHLASGRDPRNKLRRISGPSPMQMVRGRDDVNAKRLTDEMNQFRATEIMRQLKLARRGKL